MRNKTTAIRETLPFEGDANRLGSKVNLQIRKNAFNINHKV